MATLACSACGKRMNLNRSTSADAPMCRECRNAIPCGVVSRYGRGCRCAACTELKRLEQVAYTAKAKARDGKSPTQRYRPASPKRCADCGDQINGQAANLYCGPCGSRRRKKQRAFGITVERRRAIYDRDGWTCQLCGEPVPRDAKPGTSRYPSLDHIEPVSLALIPDHSDRNLRLAHAGCNASRGNRIAA